jgi:endonuclease-3
MPPESKTRRRERAAEIHRRLTEDFPEALCALQHRNAFELLAATILSAQCTDERVNMVTPALFAEFPDAHTMAVGPLDRIEELVKTTGFFRAKAKNIIEMAKALVERHAGEVPGTLDELVQLAGVGRKTANVVLGNCFGVPGLTVDTHMQRVNQRLGLVTTADAGKIEQELMQIIPQPEWTNWSHRIILHGRATCEARKPRCEECRLADLCPSYQKSLGGSPRAKAPAEVGRKAAKKSPSKDMG